jgi:N-acetylneuraminate synthase
MNRVFIIAEAGVNHNGDIKLAYRLVEKAKEAEADAIKFQTFLTEKIISRKVDMASYQKENIKSQETQFDMIKKLELSYEDFRKIKKYCDDIGIIFLSTPDEEESLDFLVDDLKVPAIKIGSGEITNLPFLRYAARKKIPIILSTGMSNLSEVEEAVNIITQNQDSVDTSIFPPLTLLHCTTNYPTPYEEVNLKAMLTLKEAFKLPVGYSDHTLGIEVPIAAIALGAKVIEKHFTLDRNLPGPDHKASLEPEELKIMIKAIRNIEKALGDGIKKPNKSEVEIMQVVRKSLVAARDIKRGEIIEDKDIVIKRSGNGIPPKFKDIIVGMKVTKDIEKDTPFEWTFFKEGKNE